MASGGTIFRKEWFRDAILENGLLRLLDRAGNTVEVVPLAVCRRFAMCDPATGKAAESKQHAERLAYFVIGAAAMTPKFNLVILDILRNKDPGTEQLGHLVMMASKWGVERIGVEDVGYQSTLIQYAVRRGLPCTAVTRRRESKESRARFAAARYEAGVVYHRRTAEPWRADLEAELETFPAGYKDQADVIADCVTAVAMAAEKDGTAYGARVGGRGSVQRGISVWKRLPVAHRSCRFRSRRAAAPWIIPPVG
jgi:predicted phage terminase large subunit-like protein